MALILRIFEPKRPQDYKELPRYARADYWHVMFRIVQVMSDDVVEVLRFKDQRLRAAMVIVGFFGLASLFGGVLNSYGSWGRFTEEFYDKYDYTFNFEEGVRKDYKYYNKINLDVGTEEEFLAEMQELHSYRFWKSDLAGFIIPPLFCIVIILSAAFIPRRCPIRFDRKREIAYTWEKGQLWIADIGPFLGGLDGRLAGEMEGNPVYHNKYINSTTDGPLAPTMFRADNPLEHREFHIGIYPVCHAHQSHDLFMFIEAFMSRHLYEEGRSEEWNRRTDWSPDWLKKIERGRFFPFDPIRWIAQNTLAKKHDFDDAKTEAALLDYLTTPSTPDRGKKRF